MEDGEIDLADLFRQVWARRKTILITTVITFLLGIFVAVFSAEEYEASIVLMPQTSSSSNNMASGLLRQFGGLAGLGGMNANASGTLSPDLYPEITQSTPFYLQMINEDVYFSTLDTTVTFTEYFTEMQGASVLDYVKTYTIGLPKLIFNTPANLINSFKNKEKSKVVLPDTTAIDSISAKSDQVPIVLTGQQLSVINRLKSRITTTIETTGMVEVSVEMPDPMAAAYTTEMAVKYLTQYIQEYRTEKSQQDLAFVEKQYKDKQEKYNIAQQRLARFQDQNMNIVTERARIEQARLQTEYTLTSSLYQGLAQQLEQAKIKVQEETPVFKVLEPIQVPLSTSKPNRELIIALSLFAGLFIGSFIAFIQIIYLNIKNKMS